MHFSIPNTEEVKNGLKSYVTYNIHINGSFHCSLRYRQLYQFHEQLKKHFGADSLYSFPPKRIFSLNSNQIEERRFQLERYIQITSQDSQIVNSDIFNSFLLAAQQESHKKISNNTIEIHQLNWQSVKVSTSPQENSHAVWCKYAQLINLGDDYLSYFGLYLVRRFGNDYRLIRKLQNFESPLLTLESVNNNMKYEARNGDSKLFDKKSFSIIIQKSYWNTSLDEDLFEDKVSLNIIYLQTLHDVEKGHILANTEIRNQLTKLQARGEKIEYIKLAKTLRYYGYTYFEPCHCDFPASKTLVKIFAGNQELIMRLITTNEEYVFRVVRIKCWRLTSSNQSIIEIEESLSNNDSKKGRFELSFEYLVSKGCLRWITIHSTQAVLISFCLQSMVEEMLLKREGKKFRSEGLTLRYNTSPISNMAARKLEDQPNDSSNSNENWSFLKKDGSLVSLSSTSENSNSSSATNVSKSEISLSSDSSFSKQNNSNNQTTLNLLSKQLSDMNLVENGVFDEIGDEDL